MFFAPRLLKPAYTGLTDEIVPFVYLRLQFYRMRTKFAAQIQVLMSNLFSAQSVKTIIKVVAIVVVLFVINNLLA